MTSRLDLFKLLPSEAGDLVTLAAGDWSLVFAPDCGARIVSLTFRGHNVLRPASAEGLDKGLVYGFGGFPLVPYSGPIFGDGFHHRKSFHALSRNVREEPTATHGEGWIRPWQVVERSAQSCALAFTHHVEEGSFPFRYEARLLYSLSDDGLTVDLSVTNMDHRIMPAGIGFHPYFEKHRGSTLRFDSSAVWPPDAPENLLKGMMPHEDGLDFSEAADISGLVFDRLFDGWDGVMTLQHPGGLTITMKADAGFPKLQIYDAWDYPYICIEPVSNANDGFNRLAQGVAGHGVSELHPQQSISGRFRIEASYKP
ncbi:aldose 1-epimerase [Aestuariivirga sp.]|uniref:aldose 1-epimerase n=1 Tax=Aestuariivirga sp. TaxID=2650926 RepID=UPI0039E456BA